MVYLSDVTSLRFVGQCITRSYYNVSFRYFVYLFTSHLFIFFDCLHVLFIHGTWLFYGGFWLHPGFLFMVLKIYFFTDIDHTHGATTQHHLTPPGSLLHSPSPSPVPPLSVWVAYTDYTSLLCLYSCTSFPGLRVDWAWALTRTRHPQPRLMLRCRSKLRNLGVNAAKFERIPQNDVVCKGNRS